MLSRNQVIRFHCPTCAAPTGGRCRRKSDDPASEGTRSSFHQDRRTYARLTYRRNALQEELREVSSQLLELNRISP